MDALILEVIVVSDEDIVVLLFIGEFVESVDNDVESGLLLKLELELKLESVVVVFRFVGNDVDVVSLGIEDDGIDVELSFVISLLVVAEWCNFVHDYDLH